VSYSVQIDSSAERDMKQLPHDVLRRIDAKILTLEDHPRPSGAKKLHGCSVDMWRLRVGDYRIVYVINDALKLVSIIGVKPRPKAYQ
jgi:mRNA interferase RelE/StbE